MLREFASTRRARLALAAVLGAALAVASCSARTQLQQLPKEAVEAEKQRQQAFRFESLIEETKRLQTVSFLIRTANVEFCGASVGSQFGLSVLSLENLDPALRGIATQRLGLDQNVSVVHVVRDSPARRAGLAPGDRIVKIGDRPIPPRLAGTRTLAQILGRTPAGQTLKVGVTRNGRALVFSLRPVQGCAFPVVFAGADQAGMFTDARRIVVHHDFLRLGSSDEELALIVSHELAHIVTGHLDKRRHTEPGEILGGFRLDVPLGASADDSGSLLSRMRRGNAPSAFGRAEETEADYLGLYFAARAGFGLKEAERFWRKMADEKPEDTAFAGIHPPSPDRFVLIGKTLDEIALKRRAKSPLRPNLKKR